MERQQGSSASTHTKVSLFFKSPACQQDNEATMGSYVCTVPNSLLESFMEQASQAGGKLEKKEADSLHYSFDGPGSHLVVDSLAQPYMFQNP